MKKSLLTRTLSILITLSMLMSIMPVIPVSAASISDEYTYRITVKNSDIRYAGTDGDIHCVVNTYSSGKKYYIIDSGSDDFERNDCRTYSMTIDSQPWDIKEVGLKNSSKDGMHINYFEFHLPNGDKVRRYPDAWFEKGSGCVQERLYNVRDGVARNISYRGNFESSFSGTKYYDVSSTSADDIVMEWNGIVSDQYFSNYNMLDYHGAVGVSFGAYGKSYGYSGINGIYSMESNNLAKTDDKNGYTNKFTLKTGDILRYMKHNKIYKLEITSSLNLSYDTDKSGSVSKSYTIYRKGFVLENANVITSAYKPYTDNYFYNSDDAYNSFEIKIPVINQDNYSSSTIASGLVSNIKSQNSIVKVYYDKLNTNNYITPKEVYSRGSDIYLKCDTPEDYANNDNVGITVVIENAKANYNGQTYSLDADNSRYEYYISTHKVDTKGLTHTLKDEDNNPLSASTGFNHYKKEHKFMLGLDAGQALYIDNNKGGRTQGNFSYRLYSKDGKTEIPLKKHNGFSETSNVPHAGNAVYTVASKSNAEGEYVLKISTRDFANNLEVTQIPVKLDTIAPRASYTVKEISPIDGSKRNEFAFTIDDLSGTGRLYYTFVRDGYSIPDTTDTKPESSGPEETLYEKWGFIDQKNSNAQTIVLSLVQGDYFKGRLYWYTTDEAGNDSRTEKISGTNANGYYYTDIVLNNVLADCEILIDDITPGKKSYDIAFETSALNKVEYRWIGKDLTTPSITYKEDVNPGNEYQKNGSGVSQLLNGEYVLEYTVTTPDGVKTKYTRDFIFDNMNPEISIIMPEQLTGPSRRLTVSTKDVSNVESVKYQLLTASGEAIGEETELTAGLPVVSDEITLTPEVSGAYKVKVTAVDINGDTSVQESPVFSIRNKGPQIELTHNITKEIHGIPVTNSQSYQIKARIREEVGDIRDYDDNQVLRYRISADGINYGEWITNTEVNNQYYTDSAAGIHICTFNIDSPVALNSGDNRVYIQAVFTDKDFDMDKIRNDLLGVADSDLIIYDDEAPQYRLNLENSTMTNQSVTGTLTVTDNYTSGDDFYTNTISSYISISANSVSEEGAIYNIVVFDNVQNEHIIVKDICGNEVQIPITVSCIDNVPPEIDVYQSWPHYSGERTDYILEFTVDKAIQGDSQFALLKGELDHGYGPSITSAPEDYEYPEIEDIPKINPAEIDDDLFGPLPENDAIEVVEMENTFDYENGESKTKYKIVVRADEATDPDIPYPEYNEYESEEQYWEAIGKWDEEYNKLNTKDYVLVAKTNDALGNSSKQSVGYGMTLSAATATINEVDASPAIAVGKTALILGMSVPVYLMPDEHIPENIKNMNIPDGRIDSLDNAEIQSFAENIVNRAVNFDTTATTVVSGTGKKSVYFVDECRRVYKQTINVLNPSEYNPDTEYDTLDCFVDFKTDIPVSVKLYKGERDDYNYSDPENPFSAFTEVNPAELNVLDFNNNQEYFLVLSAISDPSVGRTVTINETCISGLDYDFDFIGEFDMIRYNENYEYTTIVYSLANTENINKLLAYEAKIVTTDPNGVAEPIEEYIGSVFELNLLDVTGPEIDVSYSTTGYTKNDVKVNISAVDPELSQLSDSKDTNPAGSDPTSGQEVSIKQQTQLQIAQNAGIQSIEISQIQAEAPQDYNSLTYENLGQLAEAVINFTENGYAVARVTNTLGLVSYTEISVQNINKDVIKAGEHYNVKYYYTNNDGTRDVVASDGYYKEVIAKIEITAQGKETRAVYVSNNGQSEEKILTSFDNMYVFNLKDKYGHSVEVPVEHNRFDHNGPQISYELSNTSKTNQPVDVFIKLYDVLNKPDSAIMTSADGTNIPTSFVESSALSDGSIVNTYKATITDGGLYRLTGKDILGNESNLNFVVSNINKTAPYVVEKYATATEPTTQTVGVKLYYSKPGVVLTKAEAVSGTTLEQSDIIIDYINSALRIDENGTVAVEFVDEYGNIGVDTVVVDNINRTPPSLVAKSVIADDMLSVSISFEQATDQSGAPIDTKRSLEDINILYHGLSNTADKAVFQIIENGKYTFYAYDSIGNIQEIEVDVTGIDKRAPVITQVSFTYTYFDETGAEKLGEYSIIPGDEAGYNIVKDATYKETNQDVTANVTTDLPTKFVGDENGEYSLTNSIVYTEDGWFNFNLQRPNSLMDSYGLGIYLIDKIPPVIEEVEDLMFFENPNAGTAYDKSLLKYSAYDERYGEVTDLTSQVEIDYGNFNPDDITANVFDKNKPYTITYTVKDSVGNQTQVKRKITLVGLFDTMAKVNGIYPDSSGRIEIIGSDAEITLDNFSGKAYVRYEKGIYTMGEMKHRGNVIPQTGSAFKVEKLTEGWYTFYIQTDLRDYFCFNVYMYSK